MTVFHTIYRGSSLRLPGQFLVKETNQPINLTGSTLSFADGSLDGVSVTITNAAQGQVLFTAPVNPKWGAGFVGEIRPVVTSAGGEAVGWPPLEIRVK